MNSQGTGKDQAGLERADSRGLKKLGNVRPELVRKRRDRGLHSVARKIDPFQEVRDLVSPNAKRDLKHFQMPHLLTHGRVETRAALLDISEVKGCGIGDHLNMVGMSVEVGIGSGDGGDVVEGDRLGKRGAEVRIGCAAIANEPTGVDVEVHEVGEATDTR